MTMTSHCSLLLLMLTGCATFDNSYSRSFKWEGLPRPRCSDEVLATVKVLAPCPAGVVQYGGIGWTDVPFMCDNRMVVGCSDTDHKYVVVAVTLPASGNAVDSALAEELGHWAYQQCGLPHYYHEKPFIDWVNLVNLEARKACVANDNSK